MKSKSSKGMFYLVLGILFALFNVIAFVIPTDKKPTFWIAYVFSVVAFVLQIVVWTLAWKNGDTLKSKFLGIPVIHVGIVYLILQLIAFGVFMALPNIPAWVAVVVCALILGISAVCMVGTQVGKNAIEQTEARVRQKVFYIKSLQVDVELLAERETDTTVKASLQKLAEQIRFSDPISHEALADVENTIREKVEQLKTSDSKHDTIQEIHLLFVERNKKAKILK